MNEKEAVEFLKEKGFGVTEPSQYLIDIEDEFYKIWEKVEKYTMISLERGYSIYKSIEYIKELGIRGDLAECGVWKGGACMLMAYALQKFGITDKNIYLYDTYKGMTEPEECDRIAWSGEKIYERWKKSSDTKGNFMWASSLEEVKSNMLSTGFPGKRMMFIEGDVRKTLDKKRPDMLSLIRLDTDWYDSTKKELEVLYPVLEIKGVIIIDDYGHFTGAKRAVDEYFCGHNKILLNRIDYTGRTGVKI